MPSDANKTYYCEKCGKTMRADQFYTSNNLEKYPNEGKLNQCKKCITMHVDNWDPQTYLWILQEVDVPYVPRLWNDTLAKWGQDKTKVTGLSIMGRYLAKMKIKQYKDYRWKDNEFLQELENKKIREAMTRQGYDAAQIEEALQKGYVEIPEGELREPEHADAPSEETQDLTYNSPISQEVEDSLISDLTDEDKRYLCMQWGKTYRPDEWVRLEQLYQDMLNSYDIQAAGDKNTLILACKASLKSNQLLDIGDIEGAQKATKMYDSLMKSGKWTAAQNKTEENEFVDSIGEIVAICEKDGFIPKYYISEPNDYVDRVLQDLQKYTSDLITNESGLTIMMENAVKQIKEEEERIKAAAENSTTQEEEEEKMFNYDEDVIITDKDFSDFKDFELDLEKENQDILDSLFNEDGEE